jgi:hypothetical protein
MRPIPGDALLAGVFDYVIGAAEEQECKRALLAYHFLRTVSPPVNEADLAGRIDAWLRATFGVDVDFKIGDALDSSNSAASLARRGAAPCRTARRGARRAAPRVG